MNTPNRKFLLPVTNPLSSYETDEFQFVMVKDGYDVEKETEEYIKAIGDELIAREKLRKSY